MIRVVAFDFDGTLVDSNAVKEACMDAAVAGIPGGLKALACARVKGGDRYRVFAEVARQLDPEGLPTAIAAHGRKLAASYTNCCGRGICAARKRRRARPMLATLKRRGVPIWIDSAPPSHGLMPLLRRRGVTQFLTGALGGPTSNAENLRKLMRSERVRPHNIPFVGDSPDDLEAVRELGVRFVAVTAEKRISGRKPFAMRDRTGLIAVIDRLIAGPRLRRILT